jgi:TorA maturation chaperone TorD
MAVETDRRIEASRELARSAVYGLLSQALVYPMPPVVQDLVEEDLPFALALAESLPDEVADALEGFADALARVTANTLEEAFRGRFTHVHSRDCPLYETDSAKREVWRQAQDLADLGGFYRAFGLEESGERVDHVSVELEFLHVLAYKRAWALEHDQAEHAEVCRLAEEAFLRDHALRWIPDVAERLRAIGSGSPYAAIGTLMGVFLRAESARTGVPSSSWEPTEPVVGPEEIALCEEPS